MRRMALPVVLLVVAGFAAWQAWQAESSLDDPAVAPPADAPRSMAHAPVLSVRRAPRWLQRPTADALLINALTQVVAAAPADTCLVVRDNGRVVFARNGATALVPASTVKLVTASAALDVLGPDTRFRTALVAASPAANGVIAGDVWLVGAGDPVLATPAYIARYPEPQLFTNVETLADQLRTIGVTEIRGDVVGDESRYDTQRSIASWDPTFVRDHEAGPLSALDVNDGFTSYPPKEKSNTLAKPAADPAQHGAAVIVDLLRQRGITVSGVARSGKAPAGTTEITAIQSAPMRDIVGQMLSTSDNTTAELLTKELGVRGGGAGSTAAGVAVLRAVLDRAGLATGAVLNDGSGLDRGDRLSCDALAGILDRAGPNSALAAGLAVAGQNGTLRERLSATPAAGKIRAKTGSVRNSRALAGFAQTGVGAPLTFAILANHERIDAATAMAMQDRLGLELVAYPQGPSIQQLGPPPAAPGNN